MRIIVLITSWLAATSTLAALLPPSTGVSLKIHAEMNAQDYYSKELPKPSWNKDGSLSVWYQGHNTGSRIVIESGARAIVDGQQLSLCYAMQPVEYAPDQPIPAVFYPVILEFGISGLARGDYTIKEVSPCR